MNPKDDRLAAATAAGLSAAVLADALARRSGVEGWEVRPLTNKVRDGRIECEMVVKPPPGWTVMHGEDGSITPVRIPKGVTFTFGFAETEESKP